MTEIAAFNCRNNVQWNEIYARYRQAPYVHCQRGAKLTHYHPRYAYGSGEQQLLGAHFLFFREQSHRQYRDKHNEREYHQHKIH
jgi:hypothetical protein